MRAHLACAGVLVVAAACGAHRPEAPADKLARLPREGRAVIYESENEVIMAKSKRDTAARAVAEAERAIARLDASWERAKARLKKAGQGDRVGLARKVKEAHRKFLEARLSVARAARATAEAEIATAKANLARSRYGELVRYGMAPTAGLKPLEDDKAAAEESARAAEQREIERRGRAQKAFESWKQAEEEYSRATSDFDTGIWLD